MFHRLIATKFHILSSLYFYLFTISTTKSLTPLMAEVRALIGEETPTYLTFDIDGLDPAFAPGTGTPEPAGLTSSQGLEIIRGVYGTNLVGADLVEVSPPYDTTGNTSLLAANLIFEMLCSFPGCIRR